MKKILPFVVLILVLSGLGAVGIKFDINQQFLESLDQYQTEMTENIAVPIGQIIISENPQNIQVAQSFIPTLPVLTRAELFIGKNSTATYDLNVSIRDDLTGDNLAFINITPSVVPTEEYGWVNIDFDDIPITVGKTYYIVTYTVNATDNFYAWGCNNESESYVDGCAWFSIDDGGTWDNRSASSKPSNIYVKPRYGGTPRFNEYPTWDTCFKTYGIENTPPSTPEIVGQTTGKAGVKYYYIITSIDPTGDQIFYKINWGDGDVVEWFGPYDSEVQQTVNHTWDSPGDYTIRVKAKDIYEAESKWGELRVTMPRSRAINSLFLQFLQHFPILRCLLRV